MMDLVLKVVMLKDYHFKKFLMVDMVVSLKSMFLGHNEQVIPLTELQLEMVNLMVIGFCTQSRLSSYLPYSNNKAKVDKRVMIRPLVFCQCAKF